MDSSGRFWRRMRDTAPTHLRWRRWAVPCLALAAGAALLVGSVTSVGSARAGSESPVPAVAAPTGATPLVPVGDEPGLPAGAAVDGAVDPATHLTVDVVLRPSQPAALAELAAEVSTPGSSSFGHYLGRGEFARRFGGRPAAEATLRRLATAAGLSAAPVAADGLTVSVSGSAAGVERLFHTRLFRVRLADGTRGWMTSTPARLPRGLAGAVWSVVGLDELVHRQPISLLALRSPAAVPTAGGEKGGDRSGEATTGSPSTAAHPAVPTNTAVPTNPAVPTQPRACPAARAEASSSGAFTDDAIASLYRAGRLFHDGADGAGQTVAVYELVPFAQSDLAAFDTCYFGADQAAAMARRLTVIPVDGGQPQGAGVGEAALDVENVGALAPGAHLDVYEAPNTTAGSLDEFSRIIADDRASVVTTSAGLCEAAMQSGEPGVQQIENLLFEEAAAQGQTVVAAAGDTGSSDCGTDGKHAVGPLLSVDDPASQPYVLGVGGTSVTHGQAPVESVWNSGPSSGAGGGGGLSESWTAPGWQVDSGVPGMAGPPVIAQAVGVQGTGFCAARAARCREVPDVSAVADPGAGAVTVFYKGRWTAIGGTSSSAPLWAALLADTGSTEACRADGGLGFALPLLYQVAGDPASYGASFHDVTSGSNGVIPASSGLYPATAGYDMASGLGTPAMTGPGGSPGLAAALCAAAAGTTDPTVTALTPDDVPTVVGAGQPVPTITVAGSGFEDVTGRPVVSSVTIGGVRLAVGGTGDYRAKVVSTHALRVKVPPGAKVAPRHAGGDGAGSYQVVVTLVGGAASRPGPRSLLHYVDVRGTTTVTTVTGIGPTGGPRSGGGTVTVHGSGFGWATGVEFGSRPAPTVTVVSDDELTATVPPESPATRCATATATATDRATDVCQVQVVVTSALAASATETILPPYHGTVTTNAYGFVTAPAGCGCETAPAATEYDYLPRPVITSVSAATGADGRQYVSAYGLSSVVVHGSGFDILGYQWTDLGPWTKAASVDTGLTAISPDQLTLTASAAPGGAVLPLTVPLTVETLASPNHDDLASSTPPSDPVDVTYAPVPTVTGLQGGGKHSAGPRTGGTTLTVTGAHFASAVTVFIVDEVPGGPSLATSTSFQVSHRTLRFATPPAKVGVDDVLICSATSCSVPDPGVDTFTYVAAGDPSLTSAQPGTGPHRGGTPVILHGTKLGLVVGVRFGSVAAPTFSNPKGANDGGDPTTIDAVAPPGPPGTTVPITVETLASQVDGSGYSPVTTRARFTYRAKR